MNIFLPYENDLEASVKALDDARLNKQISECVTMLRAIMHHKATGEKLGYFHHPVTQFYYDNPAFIAYYALGCTIEYCERSNQSKTHKLHPTIHLDYCEALLEKVKLFTYKQPQFIPYYMEGSKGQPNYIRTTENVGELFRQKLIKKWNADKEKGRPPKWTNREVPKFYQKWLKENGDV